MIPKIVHLCWFGNGQKSENIKRCESTVRKFFAGAEIRYWTDANCPDLPFVEECRRFRKWTLLSDIVRLWALHKFGGIYLDTDVEVLRPFDPLLERDTCLVGFEHRKLDHKCIGNTVLLAPPRNGFIADNLRMLLASFLRHLKPFYAVKILNLAMMRRGLCEYAPQRLGDVEIVPYDWFYSTDHDTAQAHGYCFHHFEGSWHPKRTLGRLFANTPYRLHRLLSAPARRHLVAGTMSAPDSLVPARYNRRDFEAMLAFNRLASALHGGDKPTI